MTSSIAAIHVAKKQLGLDDETYRAKLSLITGKQSAKEMSESERQKVLTVFRNEGFSQSVVARRSNGRQKLSGKYAPKLQALWIAAWNLGIVRNRDDDALLAFVKRQTNIDHTRFLSYQDDARRAIEALKGWIAREAGVNWSNVEIGSSWQAREGFKIALAQWEKLGGEELRRPFSAFVTTVQSITGIFPQDMTDHDWIPVMNALGKRIRAGRGSKQ
ncbi:regulatory protein GemA [Rhizobium sullae]|uniref:Regulatory protein GemA n=1 Tax=Rhizobium sullae TaxID=50338 RepID=A0ABY5XGF5_RHISU|nr:regulatory protein GemA [Rhizobium sullae]UWU13251.1 regulatory protein GemA [Rhizobium sullae]